ncbi:hypothetical protein D3C71_1896970 [compost metagenome]
MNIFHADSAVNALLVRGLPLQIVLQLIQGLLIHSTAVIADMEQQFMCCEFTSDADMHVLLAVIQSVIGGILYDRLEHQLDNVVII